MTESRLHRAVGVGQVDSPAALQPPFSYPTRAPCDSGSVDVSQGDPCVLRRSVGMVFQPTVFGSVLDRLRAAEELDSTAAADLLGDVALDASFLDRRARDLSGGEQQQLCLARTLATSPVALLVRDLSTGPESDEGPRGLVVDLARRGTPCSGSPMTSTRRPASRIIAGAWESS
ncbi:MAG: ATP-binding cassette domain-containing protein [Microthrixaceae bacterium]